jgi:hypothetical protein
MLKKLQTLHDDMFAWSQLAMFGFLAFQTLQITFIQFAITNTQWCQIVTIFPVVKSGPRHCLLMPRLQFNTD